MAFCWFFKKRKEDSLTDENTTSDEQEQSQSWITLAQDARQQLSVAEEKQRTGDWAGYGEALDQLSLTLEALERQASEQLGGAQEETASEENMVPVAPEENVDSPE